MDNAIKFIEDEGAIHLTIRAERNEENQNQKEMKNEEEEEEDKKDQVIISIKDTGIGISKDIFPRLFTKFTTTSITGTGLGLYISKSIVEAHGGRIWAENNINGKGASFTFTLPLSKKENNNN